MDPIITQQNILEIQLRGIRLAIQFKSFFLSLDVQSRRQIIDYCKRWFELETRKTTENTELNNKLYSWFQHANYIYMNDDESSRKRQITDAYIWDDLYTNLSPSLSFQKLVAFFLNGAMPQEDLR
jgi:uncharacterized protein YaaW (UPF0174 family)